VWSPVGDREEAESYSERMSAELRIPVDPVDNVADAIAKSDVCITCTPSRSPFLKREWIHPGMFLAAVGADSPDKQELDADLTAGCKVVADIRSQVICVGETHHAIEEGLMTSDQVHAEIGEVLTGGRPGRTSADEVFLYDSTGTALQDVAAAAAVYERAREQGRGIEWLPS